MPRGFKNNNPTETAKRNFLDKESFVSGYPNPGHDVLYGDDWKIRRIQLGLRCKGQCERVVRGAKCNRPAAEPHHLDNKTGRRCDCLHNLLALCRQHHEQVPQHAKRKPMWTPKKGTEQ